MPEIEQLGNGLVRITDETGTTYDVSPEVAQQSYPEQFEQPQEQNPYGPGNLPTIDNQMQAAVQPQVQMEPTLVQAQAQQPANPYSDENMAQTFGAGQPVEPPPWEQPGGEMSFTNEEAGEVDAPMAPEFQSQSQSSSRSYSGTGRYDEAPAQGFPGLPATRDAEEAYGEAYKQRKEALQGAAKANEDHQAAQEINYAERAVHRAVTAARQQAMHEEAMVEVEAGEAALQDRIDGAQRMDMNKVWKDSSASTKLVGILSAGIAGWLNPTGKNSVVEQMMQLADQSAKEQAANMAQERWQIGQQQNALGRSEDRGEQERIMYLETRAMLEANIVDQISLESSKYKSEITLANFQEKGAAAIEQYTKTRMDIRNATYDRGFARATTKAQLAQQTANRKQQAAKFRMEESGRNARAEASRKAAAVKAVKPGPQLPVFAEPNTRTKVYPNPQIWADMTGEAKTAYKAKIKMGHSVADALRSLDDANKKWGEILAGGGVLGKSDLNPDSPAYLEIKAKAAKALEVIGFAAGGKAFSGSEMAIFTDQMGDVDTYLSGSDNGPKIAAMMKAAADSNRRLYGETLAEVVEDQSEPYGGPGDLGRHEPKYGMVPYEGQPDQFRLNEQGAPQVNALNEQIDLIGAAVDDMESVTGPAQKAAAAKRLESQYMAVGEKFRAGEYDAKLADETAVKIDSILARVPKDLRPRASFGTEWIGTAAEASGIRGPEASVSKDFESYGQESEGVRRAIEDLISDATKSGARSKKSMFGVPDGRYTYKELKAARDLLNINEPGLL